MSKLFGGLMDKGGEFFRWGVAGGVIFTGPRSPHPPTGEKERQFFLDPPVFLRNMNFLINKK